MKPLLGRKGTLKNELTEITIPEIVETGEEWVSVAVVAERQKVSVQTILNRVRRKEIKGRLLFGRIVVSIGKIERNS